MSTSNYDPFDVASNPDEHAVTFEDKGFWGECKVKAWGCNLVKGVGKVPYDPKSGKRPLTAVRIEIVPLPEQIENQPVLGQNFNITQREEIAEFKTWRDLIWPSLRALQVNSLHEVNNKFVHITTVETGDTYEKSVVDDNGNTTVVTKKSTTFQFDKIFTDRQACLDDYMKENAIQTPPWTNATPQPAPPAQAAPANGDAAGKEIALQFAKVIVNSAVTGQTDLAVIRKTVDANISSMPLVANHLSVDSPEVMQMIMEAMQA